MGKSLLVELLSLIGYKGGASVFSESQSVLRGRKAKTIHIFRHSIAL